MRQKQYRQGAGRVAGYETLAAAATAIPDAIAGDDDPAGIFYGPRHHRPIRRTASLRRTPPLAGLFIGGNYQFDKPVVDAAQLLDAIKDKTGTGIET